LLFSICIAKLIDTQWCLFICKCGKKKKYYHRYPR